MGRTLIILMAGFAASFGLLAMSKNQRLIESVDRMMGQYASHSAQNASASGVYMALNQLYLNQGWRTGYNQLHFGGDILDVAVTDNSVDTTLGMFQIKISSNSSNTDANDVTQAIIFDRSFHEFAVWAKDTVISITVQNETGLQNDSLLIQKAPFMPKIDHDNLVNEATSQGHTHGGSYAPSTGYPNGSFYYSGATPNVTYVGGNLVVRSGRTVYGIYIVDGDATFEGGGTLNGIVYFPNTANLSSRLRHTGTDVSQSLIKGGVVTWGGIDGTGGDIVVQHFSTYFNNFVSNYAPNNPPMRVLSWK